MAGSQFLDVKVKGRKEKKISVSTSLSSALISPSVYEKLDVFVFYFRLSLLETKSDQINPYSLSSFVFYTHAYDYT